MLFTDSDGITVDDLLKLDDEIGADASAETVHLSDVIETAWAQVKMELQAKLQGFWSHGGVSANHAASVMDIGRGSAEAIHRCDPASILVEPRGTIYYLLTWHAVSRFYKKVFSRKIADTYEARYLLADREIANLYRIIGRTGVPIVNFPLSRPAAKHENSGTWETSNVSYSTLNGCTGGSFTVKISWVSVDGIESEPSDEQVIVIPANKALSVSIATLIPPTGSAIVDGQTWPRTAATGWHIYTAPLNSSVFRRQTSTAIPVATTSYTLLADPDTATGALLASASRQTVTARLLPINVLHRV